MCSTEPLVPAWHIAAEPLLAAHSDCAAPAPAFVADLSTARRGTRASACRFSKPLCGVPLDARLRSE
jgi:hypothetical protein